MMKVKLQNLHLSHQKRRTNRYLRMPVKKKSG
jgi:hypothetical protein